MGSQLHSGSDTRGTTRGCLSFCLGAWCGRCSLSPGLDSSRVWHGHNPSKSYRSPQSIDQQLIRSAQYLGICLRYTILLEICGTRPDAGDAFCGFADTGQACADKANSGRAACEARHGRQGANRGIPVLIIGRYKIHRRGSPKRREITFVLRSVSNWLLGAGRRCSDPLRSACWDSRLPGFHCLGGFESFQCL